MKTKIFTLLLAVAASIGTMHAAIINGTCGTNLTWSLNTKDSTLAVEGSGNMQDFYWPNYAPWSEHSSYIKYVFIADGVSNIGKSAFRGYENIASVSIPSSIMSIGEYAFDYCYGLKSVYISDIAAWCNIRFGGATDTNPLYYAHNLYLNDSLVTNLVIPSSITSISGCAFAGCSTITSVVIPSTITSIGSEAFRDCIGLSSVHISDIAAWCAINFGDNPLGYAKNLFLNDTVVTTLVISNDIISIAKKAFYGCTSVTSVTISNSVTNIGEQAFYGCSGLTSIVIGNSVANIGNYTFYGCSNLDYITCGSAIPPTISNSTFPSYSTMLFVPEESVEAYQNALYWEEFTDIRAIGSAPLVQFLDWDGIILSSANVTIGTAATAPADPTRTGYTFIGWDKDFSNITEDLVVTAQYKINRYEVIFKDWDGTILKSDSVDYNTAATAPANPLREGHEFIGWDKDFSHVSSDMVINARYAVNYYPVGFLNYDGTLLSEQSIAYNQAAMEPNVPAREGYTFIGWTADIEHITARTFAIALYEKDGINVTYISEEGDTIVSEKVDMHLPDAPIVSGKTFTGWLTESASNAEGIVFRATYTLDNPTTGEDVVVIPTSSTASVSFPYITGAMTYMLVIRDLFGTVVCKIMFDADGHLLGIAFAPGRNRTQKAQSEGFHFTVEGLTPGTTYEYEFVAYDEADQVIETLSGSFETTADATSVNNISSASAPQKVINDGHVLILRGDKTYTMQGQEVK